ncbi:MAG: peroxide stress protein YaaA [Flavobacteriales bacterium]
MKSKFIAVLSPAKLMSDRIRFAKFIQTRPVFLEEAEYLVKKLKKFSVEELCKLMDMNKELGLQTAERFKNWSVPVDRTNSLPAILLFEGEVYRGLSARKLSPNQLKWAHGHIRILSGLYGVLRPMDLVQPYRLMMGTPYSPLKKYKNLYEFWDYKLGQCLREDLEEDGILVNLASKEYFKAIDLNALQRRVLHCEFKQRKGDKVTVIATYAKFARGLMANYIINNEITDIEKLKEFNLEGYRFDEALSTENEYVFVR